jgi:hypothetical protein
VFCPLSVTVEEHPRELTECAMARRMAEDLCVDDVRCIGERLPRLRTDQTAALVDLPSQDGARIVAARRRRASVGGPVSLANRGSRW